MPETRRRRNGRAGQTIQTERGTLRLRPEEGGAAEEAFLYLLFSAIKAPEMALMPISTQHKEHLLQIQYRSMNATYRHHYPDARFEIVELDRWPVGRLVTAVQEHCVYYVDIALLPQASGLGLGTALMTSVLAEPRRLGLPARVKVLSHNIPSLRLMRRVGFTPFGSTPPYVDLEWRPGG
ncbi:MAG TPA: GNAT family N-acetyltransferase [Aliidongia sp.]|nr:GNAT family N-acetyltransferase [Aliidongia sp.]